ncbi:MAG: hypothetical protein BAJALOKI2v1_700002 [Promethearchaeota archaeon]|nr:MAG: hypothetical protein BAJALOKI2v1_700002 [Candidatus Lokiarchaeota archaeon]
MKRKNILLILLIAGLLIPISFVSGYEYKEKVKTSFAVYYLVDLNEGDDLTLELIPYENGSFSLFLFDEKITKSHINNDGSIDPEIYDKAIQYDNSEIPSITYTAEDYQIYYIQIILMENGPDIFTLESNQELSRYYLPQVPGFPTEVILSTSIIILGIILVYNRKKFTPKSIN